MASFQGKRVLLGVTGGIAAYKAAYLVRRLREIEAQVQVVMTPAAESFITPMTLQALSGLPVRTDLMDLASEAAMGHIELARWADLVLIVPASADFMARLAHGFANDLLSTLCLATSAPVFLAPAMNQQMWANSATQANREILERRGIGIWGPDEGDQACGETGPGRMIEPDNLIRRLLALESTEGPLRGARVLVTAGPTREPIDPVRFIGNRSSGRMGYALAEALCELGAGVLLVSGPVSLAAPNGVQKIGVETAEEMAREVMDRIDGFDIFVATAAVADYRPEDPAEQKIKKGVTKLSLRLTRNPDILASVASMDSAPFTVGFAAETERVEEHAEEKRRAKGVDLIAANKVGGLSGGFESTENALTVLWDGGRAELPLMPKVDIARRLAAIIAERYEKKNSTENPGSKAG